MNGSDQQQLKYRVARVFIIFYGLMIVVHLVDDALAPRWDEVWLNTLQLSVAIAAALYIRPERMRMQVYWIIAVATLVTPMYLVAKGGGDGTSIFYMFFIPPVAIYFLGLRYGVSFTVAALITIVVLIVSSPLGYVYSYETLLRFFLAYLVIAVVTGVLEGARASYANRLEVQTAELTAERQARAAAQRDVKVLSGLLPICSVCKCIRVDDARWEDIETYVAERSDADFSHTVCPACSAKLYPDIS
ncbi:MAG: hypothetical protein AAFX44_19470 [Pseudomonadota bacterium]